MGVPAACRSVQGGLAAAPLARLAGIVSQGACERPRGQPWANPRGDLGRPGGGKAMQPSHAGNGPEARDPLVGRLWSLSR